MDSQRRYSVFQDITFKNQSSSQSPMKRFSKQGTNFQGIYSPKNMRRQAGTYQMTKSRIFSDLMYTRIQRIKIKLKAFFMFKQAQQIVNDKRKLENKLKYFKRFLKNTPYSLQLLVQYSRDYKKLVRILGNTYKSQDNTLFILDYIKSLSFFQGFISNIGDVDEGALYELCKRLKYEFYPAGEYIFLEGEPSNEKYYVILRGSVGVVVKKDRNVFHQDNIRRGSDSDRSRMSLNEIEENEYERDELVTQGGNVVSRNSLTALSSRRGSIEQNSSKIFPDEVENNLNSPGNSNKLPSSQQLNFAGQNSLEVPNRKFSFNQQLNSPQKRMPRNSLIVNYGSQDEMQDAEADEPAEPAEILKPVPETQGRRGKSSFFQMKELNLVNMKIPIERASISSSDPSALIRPAKRKTSKTNLNTQQQNKSKNYMKTQIARQGVKIKDLIEGEGFGELALTSNKSIRTTSIIANQCGCEMLIISKDDYNNIIKKYDKRRQGKLDFMKFNIPFLDNINSTDIWEDLFSIIKEQEVLKHTEIIQEGKVGSKVFFIKEGFCTLEKTFLVDHYCSKDKIQKIPVKREIATVGPGSVLAEEIFIGNHRHKYTVRVQSMIAIVYTIDRVSMTRFPTETLKSLIDNFKDKEKYRKEANQKIYKEVVEQVRKDVEKQGGTIASSNSILNCVGAPIKANMINKIKQYQKTTGYESIQDVHSLDDLKNYLDFHNNNYKVPKSKSSQDANEKQKKVVQKSPSPEPPKQPVPQRRLTPEVQKRMRLTINPDVIPQQSAIPRPRTQQKNKSQSTVSQAFLTPQSPNIPGRKVIDRDNISKISVADQDSISDVSHILQLPIPATTQNRVQRDHISALENQSDNNNNNNNSNTIDSINPNIRIIRQTSKPKKSLNEIQDFMMEKLNSMKAKKNWDFTDANDPEQVKFDFGKNTHQRKYSHHQRKSMSSNSQPVIIPRSVHSISQVILNPSQRVSAQSKTTNQLPGGLRSISQTKKLSAENEKLLVIKDIKSLQHLKSPTTTSILELPDKDTLKIGSPKDRIVEASSKTSLHKLQQNPILLANPTHSQIRKGSNVAAVTIATNGGSRPGSQAIKSGSTGISGNNFHFVTQDPRTTHSVDPLTPLSIGKDSSQVSVERYQRSSKGLRVMINKSQTTNGGDVETPSPVLSRAQTTKSVGSRASLSQKKKIVDSLNPKKQKSKIQIKYLLSKKIFDDQQQQNQSRAKSLQGGIQQQSPVNNSLTIINTPAKLNNFSVRSSPKAIYIEQ